MSGPRINPAPIRDKPSPTRINPALPGPIRISRSAAARPAFRSPGPTPDAAPPSAAVRRAARPRRACECGRGLPRKRGRGIFGARVRGRCLGPAAHPEHEARRVLSAAPVAECRASCSCQGIVPFLCMRCGYSSAIAPRPPLRGVAFARKISEVRCAAALPGRRAVPRRRQCLVLISSAMQEERAAAGDWAALAHADPADDELKSEQINQVWQHVWMPEPAFLV